MVFTYSWVLVFPSLSGSINFFCRLDCILALSLEYVYHSFLIDVVFIYVYSLQLFHLNYLYLILSIFLRQFYSSIFYTPRLTSEISYPLPQFVSRVVSIKPSFHISVGVSVPPLPYIVLTMFPCCLFESTPYCPTQILKIQ